jgi:hypothetical protein
MDHLSIVFYFQCKIVMVVNIKLVPFVGKMDNVTTFLDN